MIKVFYPNTHTETTSVDGFGMHEDIMGKTWSNLKAASGTSYNDDSSSIYVGYTRRNPPNDWLNLTRGVILFDTSILPSSAVIKSATISLYCNTKRESYSNTPAINIYGFTQSITTSLDNNSFNTANHGTTQFSTTISYASMNTSQYNNFILNSSGLAEISKTGLSKFSIRETTYDAGSSTPTNPGGTEDGQGFWFDSADGTNKPKLIITYNDAVVSAFML